MKTSQVPVLVVGAGAAGTMLTLELARRGVRVRTVDRLPRAADTSRAITVHARTAEIFERIDKRLIERFLDRGIQNKGYVLHFVDAEGRRSEVRSGIDFTALESRYPFMLVHRQSETEQYLREYTGAHFGVSPDWGTSCIDVQQDDSGVTATLESGGIKEQVRCYYLVACDGPDSLVRGAIGVEQGESDNAGTVLENLDVYLDGFTDADDYVHYGAGRDHFIMIVKLPGGFYRLLRSASGEAAGADVAPEQAFMQLVDRHFDGVKLGKVVWHSEWQSHARLAHTYRRGRVFLAGDAAHVHSTAGGQGLNCCMQDAYNLGWKLAFVVKRLARPTLLDSYELERRPVAAQAIAAASSLQEVFMGHGKDIAERARKVHDREFLASVINRCAGLSYDYSDQAAKDEDLAAIEGPGVGGRAPDVDFGGGRALFDYTRHPRCTLLALAASDAVVGRLGAELKPLVHRFKAVLDLHVVPPSVALAGRYGSDAHDRLFLLRPDGYVGFRCLASEGKRLETRLAEWFAL